MNLLLSKIIDNILLTNQLNSKEGLLALNLSGDILAMNQRAKSLLFISELEQEYTSLNFLTSFAFLHAKSQKNISLTQNPISKLINEDKKVVEDTIGISNTDGTPTWLTLNSKKIKEEDEIIILISIFDSTKVVNQNVELDAQKKQMALLVSSLNDIVFECTTEGKFLNYWTNDEDNLFYSPDHFLGKRIDQLFPKELSNKALKKIKIAKESGKSQKMTFAAPTEFQKKKWFEFQVNPILNTKNKIAIIISDITQKVMNAEKIKFNEHKFNQAFHFSGLGTSLTDLEGFSLDSNKELYDMLGYSKEDLKVQCTFDFTHPDDKQSDILMRQKLINKELNSFSLEKRYLHKKGYYVWCSVTISLVRNQFDAPLFFIVQLQNITENKKNQEILVRQKMELEDIKLRLESKLNQLKEFNYIVAHNLMGPTSNIQMLLNDLKSIDNNKDRAIYLEHLQTSSTELRNTLHDLVNILDIQSIHNKAQSQCDFEPIVSQSIKELLPLYNPDEITFKYDFQVESMEYNEEFLISIISNLLSNAVTFRKKNEHTFITAKTYKEGDKVIFSLEDNGLGLDLEKHKSELFMYKKVFHPDHKANGVGLFIVKYLVESLGGKIDVTSEINVGSTFYVQF